MFRNFVDLSYSNNHLLKIKKIEACFIMSIVNKLIYNVNKNIFSNFHYLLLLL